MARDVRQLKNVTEQVSIIERERSVDALTLKKYLPDAEVLLPTVAGHEPADGGFASEREILYKILFDMKKDMNDLKRLVYDLMQREPDAEAVHEAVSSPGTSLVLHHAYDTPPVFARRRMPCRSRRRLSRSLSRSRKKRRR